MKGPLSPPLIRSYPVDDLGLVVGKLRLYGCAHLASGTGDKPGRKYIQQNRMIQIANDQKLQTLFSTYPPTNK